MPGEIVAVAGRNGAGKTTLTKLANGLLAPASGRVRVCGLDTREAPVSAIARRAATLFQNPDRQLCRPTVLEEVAFGPELHGEDPASARARAAAVIECFGLPASASPFSLSRGQRQMVALASVAACEPELVILDEPTAGLDYRECMTVMQTVARMRLARDRGPHGLPRHGGRLGLRRARRRHGGRCACWPTGARARSSPTTPSWPTPASSGRRRRSSRASSPGACRRASPAPPRYPISSRSARS